MKLNRFKVSKIVVAALILFVLLNHSKLIRREFKKFHNKKKDIAVQYEEKLQPVRQLLPTSVSVGFKTDDKDAFTPLFLIQYVLAPHHVLLNEIKDYIILDFKSPQEKAAFVRANQLSLLKTIDNTMALYRRRNH